MKWRPQLRTVLLVVNLVILLLPLAGIWILRLYESELIRQTESELIAQGVIVSAAYRDALQRVRRETGENVAESIKEHYGEKSPNMAIALNNLAKVLAADKEYKKAERLFKQALANLKSNYGKSHPYVGMTLKNLGDLYQDWGKDKKSEKSYNEAIEVLENTFGPDSVKTKDARGHYLV